MCITKFAMRLWVIIGMIGVPALADYRYFRIHDTFGPSYAGGTPAVNNLREVMYLIIDPGGLQLYSSGSNAGAFTYYADTYGQFRGFNSWAIDDWGNVVYAAERDDNAGHDVRVVWIGENFSRPVVTVPGFQNPGQPLVMSIERGHVVVATNTFTVSNAVYFWSGGNPIVLLSNSSNSGYHHASLNDAHEIVVSGPGSEYFGTINGMTAVGPPRQTTSPMNEAGLVAEIAGDAIRLHRPSDGMTQMIIDTSGGFQSFSTDAIALNNRGQVAFAATRDDGVFGVFTGPDADRDLVVRIGQTVLGRPITGFSIGPNAINDRGQVAVGVTYQFAPVSAVVLADPLAGDITMDCTVSISDLNRLLSHFGRDTLDYFEGDIVQNRRVDLNDLVALLSQFGQACP